MNAAAEEGLHVRLSETVQAALDALRRSLGEAGIPMRTQLLFTRSLDPEGRVGLQPQDQPAVNLDSLALPLHIVLENLPEADDFLAFVIADEALDGIVRTYEGEMIEDVDTQRWFLRQWTLLPFMRYYLGLRTDAEWNAGSFDVIFPDLVRHLDGETLPIELLAPLDHFKSDVGFLDLGKGTSIAALTDEELSAIYDQWGPRNTFGKNVTMDNLLAWTHAIKHEKVDRLSSGQQVEGFPIQDAVTALRLLRGSAVTTSFTWERHKRYAFAQAANEHLSYGASSSFLQFGNDLNASKEDAPVIKLLFERLRAAERQDSEDSRRFSLALRRLNASVERVTTEDKLIDYWVALETLFVSDARGEIKYRARTRITRYLEDAPAPRRELAKTLGDSYNRRSEVVHGDSPKADLSELTDRTGEILRRVLRRMLEYGRTVDLEALDFG